MKGMHQRALICVCIFALVATCAYADTVVLNDGTSVRGKVDVRGKNVTVESETGILTIPAWRVKSVSRIGEETAAPKEEKRTVAGPAGVVEAKAEKPDSAAAAEKAGKDNAAEARSARRTLAMRISVAFADTPLTEALAYVQEVSGGNFSYRPADIEADDVTVTFKLDNVTVRQVLDLLLEGRELVWTVRGDIIRITPPERARRTSVRVYRVHDLLVNTSDRVVSRTRTASETSQSKTVSAQADSDNGGSLFTIGSAGAVTPKPSAAERTKALAELITKAIRPNDWGQPAIVVLGGAIAASGEEDDFDDIW